MSEAAKELNDIKRLMMLLLLKLGASPDEIALALQVDASLIRKTIPSRKVKKIVSEKG
ncbi:hypothetical protein [Bradyrhizobium sp. SZCCHNR2026]|uniref:hypothetical protein n=1 Tax=Bradyrhizobium sp. SZCCHNR2026 TaxID=3057381 RepID=UPI002915E93C|nr:hypothetical protein [Bradyrhizobium sp. SZCCHNR2026]